MIDKKIHYIWLGKGGKSKLSEIRINSWYNGLGDDYEIVEWNEDNLDLEELRKGNGSFLVKLFNRRNFVEPIFRFRLNGPKFFIEKMKE